MEQMSGFSPSWDYEGLAQQSNQKQRLANPLHRPRNTIGLENDHLVETQPDKRNNLRVLFPRRSKLRDEHDHIWHHESSDYPFSGKRRCLTQSVSSEWAFSSEQALWACPLRT